MRWRCQHAEAHEHGLRHGTGDWIYLFTADDERLWSYRVGGGGSLWSLRDLAGQVIRQFEAHTSWSTTRDYVHRDGQLFATILPSGWPCPGFTGVHAAPSPPVGFLYHSNG